MAHKITERVAICETEITHLKIAVSRICENEIPHIYTELDKITHYLSDLKPIFKNVEENTEAIRNQEKLGKKEKAAILLAAITGITSIILAYFGVIT